MMLRRLAPLLVLVLVGLTACSSVGESSAATVNGERISPEAVQQELKTIRSNTQYRQAVEQQYGIELGATANGTFASAFTAQVLSLQVYYRLFEQKMDDLNIAPTASEERAAVANLREQLKSLKGKKFPEKYIKQLAHQDALVGKLQTEAKIVQACPSHILVSTESRSDAEAKRMAGDLERQLAAGADFEALAASSSDDPSGADGGDLGCGPRGRFVAPFENAVFSQPVGKVGNPVKTRFGYHLILVRSRKSVKLGELDPQVGQQAFGSYVAEITCGSSTKVSVNPRFGRWDRSPCRGGQGLARVTAPKAPAASKS